MKIMNNILAFLIAITMFFVAKTTIDILTMNKGDYIFNRVNYVVNSANKARGENNTILNSVTIKKLEDMFFKKVKVIDDKKVLNTEKKYQFIVKNNKIQLSGIVTYKYYKKMQESYSNQLNVFSKKFNFNSTCEEEVKKTCQFTISEK